ncbi:SMP-30/gluconolactonase/LRE family protein [Candidatus Pantoea multigeneris]|uniref:Major royal jelly protein n=1 Tax=Candidatus Pantoea multigeneris TaxID=2608357 RepID=A0ABX0RJE2_9GAMM|nr:L-dopachrome tautomerase-related protein [Pantoea multigeneris]NIF23754.1 hypothetical protein [Pantoea multigeneris]
MRSFFKKTLPALAIGLLCQHAFAKDVLPAKLPTKEDSRLQEMATSNHIWNGVTVSQDGRIFASFTQTEGPGLQLAEVGKNAQLTPVPDAEWNHWDAKDPEHHFLHVNATRFGPDGFLYAMDAGNTGIGTGAQAVVGGAKLVKIDANTRKVVQTWVIKPPILKPTSYLDDVRFNGDFAYISDPGAPGFVILNMKTGDAHRVLDNHPLAIDHLPLYADGKKLYLPNGKEKRVGADQLEVSPDGKWLLFQAIPGPLARIETRYIDDAKLSEKEVAKHVHKVLDTWTTGGTAIDSDGNVYMSQLNTRSVMRITPEGKVSTVISDPRLVWIDAMWVSKGALWMPAGQINRTPATTGGKPSTVEYPVKIFKIDLPIAPSPRDHQ